MTELSSRLYTGWIRHRRFLPKRHDFRYPIFMSYLDLEELAEVMSKSRLWSLEWFNLVSFYRRDYLYQNDGDLQTTVKTHIKMHTGEDFTGRIFLLTHLRYLGFCFNPVSFYFCFTEKTGQLRFIIAEIHNTPWNERFCYLLDTSTSSSRNNGNWTFAFDKAFHVSPFMPMALRYQWRFSLHKDNLTIHMKLLQNGSYCFDATLQLQACEMTAKTMRRIPLRFPFMTLSVLVSIYRQALLLRLKKIPFYSHPGTET